MRWNGWDAAIMAGRERAGAHFRYDDTSLFGTSPRFGCGNPTASNFTYPRGHGMLHVFHFLTKLSSTARPPNNQ